MKAEQIEELKNKQRDSYIDLMKDFATNYKIDEGGFIRYAAYTVLIEALEKEECK